MFYSIPNLRSHSAVELPKPWDYVPETPAPYDDRNEYIRWRADFATRHAFISGYEGISPGVRITKGDNPPFKLHAFVVDYDGKLPEKPDEHVKNKPAGEFLPNYVCKTGRGNGRLIWMLERPLLLASDKQIHAFLKIVKKAMNLDKWLSGLDTECFADATQYFDIGQEWLPVAPEARIPAANTELWLMKASHGLRFDTEKRLEYDIPVEEIAKEVEAQFPGRWNGAFVLGARGVRFWDPVADNPTGAVVGEEGMFCFTGDQAFVPWKQIFGAKFVEPFEASYVADIVHESAYDGRSYWLDTGSHWQDWSKEDFSQELRCRGYDGRKKTGKPASELDIIENMIKKDRRVFKALPFLFFPSGVISYHGKRYLNTSNVKPIAPSAPVAAGAMTWADGPKFFPFIHRLMTGMFRGDEDDATQLTGFLAWLKYFYCNSLDGRPRPGHTLVLAGPTGKGKTLFSKAILGGLMGGQADGSRHLVDGSQWTEGIASAPVLRIDDSLAVADSRGLIKFSNRLKKYAANAEMAYEEKYKTAAMVPWFGRIIVTCNLDAESLRILPNMDMSTKDKISLFKASEEIMKFPEWGEVSRLVSKELPLLARFLVDWPLPEEWISEERRFGVRPFHHRELFEESRQQGLGTIIELLKGFLDEYKKGSVPGQEEWTGSAVQLYADLTAYSPDTAREFKSHGLAIFLGRLAKNGYGLYKERNTCTKLNHWHIKFDFIPATEADEIALREEE